MSLVGGVWLIGEQKWGAISLRILLLTSSFLVLFFFFLFFFLWWPTKHTTSILSLPSEIVGVFKLYKPQSMGQCSSLQNILLKQEMQFCHRQYFKQLYWICCRVNHLFVLLWNFFFVSFYSVFFIHKLSFFSFRKYLQIINDDCTIFSYIPACQPYIDQTDTVCDWKISNLPDAQGYSRTGSSFSTLWKSWLAV